MRITNNSIARTSLNGIQDNLRRLDDAQHRATTGLRISRASDDPVGAASVLSASRGLRALEQYRRNIAAGSARLAAEESGLDQLSDLLTRARELALSQATGTANGDTREHVRSEVDALFDSAIQIANTRIDGVFLYGGQHPLERPVMNDGSIAPDRPPAGSSRTAVAAGQFAQLNHDGVEVFIDSGVLASVQELRNALDDGDTGSIEHAAASLTDAFDRVQTLLAEVGARINRVETSESNIEALELNLRTLRSDISEVDLETALMDLVNRQTTLQAAMAATSRMLSITLTDYLR